MRGHWPAAAAGSPDGGEIVLIVGPEGGIAPGEDELRAAGATARGSARPSCAPPPPEWWRPRRCSARRPLGLEPLGRAGPS